MENYSKTEQKPLLTGYGRKTRASEVVRGIDLTGVNAVVTGGYSGIGLETVRILTGAGAFVTVPVRNKKRAAETLAGLNVEIEEIDLGNPASIDAFAERYTASGRALHILINNAGIMAPPLTRDERGYELQFATNHLGHFRLTARLFPALVKAASAENRNALYKSPSEKACNAPSESFSGKNDNTLSISFSEKDDNTTLTAVPIAIGNAPSESSSEKACNAQTEAPSGENGGATPPVSALRGARVITLSSRAHRRSAFDFDDPNYLKTPYDPWKAYGRSKTANCLFAVELDRRAVGLGIRSFAVHPGLIPSTNISNAKNKGKSKLYKTLTSLGIKAMNALKVPVLFTAVRGLFPRRRGNELKTLGQGAATTVFCAVSPLLNGMGGVYCEDCDIAQAVPADGKTAYGVRPWATDPEKAARLWRLSEELNDIEFKTE